MARQFAGRPSEAIPLFEQALAGLERVFGSAHPETVRARENLVRAQTQTARRKESEAEPTDR
jgi:hypothetical protein